MRILIASRQLDRWSRAWRNYCQRLPSLCGHHDCRMRHDPWRRLRRRPEGILVQGVRYCRDECTERALTDTLRRLRPGSGSNPSFSAHRVPLGLLLLSRQQLSAEQLQVALAAQRSTGRGRIGEWLLAFGFASEQQITAALARQWSCPVLRASSLAPYHDRAPQIPSTLLVCFAMIPIDYVESSATLHVAFGEGLDYSVLYAIEQMLECRTEACMAVPSLVRERLGSLPGHRGECEIVIESVADAAELSRIIQSYCARLSASDIRLASCGPHLWVRLRRGSAPTVDLLLRSPRQAAASASPPSPSVSPPLSLQPAG